MKNISKGMLCLCLIVSSQALAADWDFDSKYRHVKNDVGNCVFSTEVMNFGTDSGAGYDKMSTTFKTGDDIYMRCYFPSKAKKFESAGKRSNSIRDQSQIFYQLIWPKTKSKKFSARTRDERDQQRFDLIRDPKECSFHKTASSCINPDDNIRSAAKALNKQLPFTQQVCMKVAFRFSDKQFKSTEDYREFDRRSGRKEWKEREVWYDAEYDQTISEGCFDWTVMPIATITSKTTSNATKTPKPEPGKKTDEKKSNIDLNDVWNIGNKLGDLL